MLQFLRYHTKVGKEDCLFWYQVVTTPGICFHPRWIYWKDLRVKPIQASFMYVVTSFISERVWQRLKNRKQFFIIFPTTYHIENSYSCSGIVSMLTYAFMIWRISQFFFFQCRRGTIERGLFNMSHESITLLRFMMFRIITTLIYL